MSVETLEHPDQMLAGPLTPERVEEVALQFQPRTEVDDQGLTRTIFEHQGITFSFMGREETPVYPTVEHSRPTYLGRESDWMKTLKNNKPSFTDEFKQSLFENDKYSEDEISGIESSKVEEWQKERARFTDFEHMLGELRHKNTESGEHLLVEQSAYGLYALLERLQPDNPRWKREREAIEANEYDDEALLVIDMVTALNAVGLKRNDTEEAKLHPPMGETVVLAAFMGDESAQSLAKQAVGLQEEKELAKEERIRDEIVEYAEQLEAVEAFRPEDLVVVHATNYAPEASEDGFTVQTTHDGRGFPRPTIHTAINHKVESHVFGSWDNKDHVLIAGFDKMLDVDGSPNSINGADTWWARNPGERLTFPGATLIAPGGPQTEVFKRLDDGRVLYKTEGITTEDISTIDTVLGSGTQAQIEKALNDESGKHIDIASEAGQHIVANIIRDALVRIEITEVRGKQLLRQDDDKVMDEDTGKRLFKMAGQAGLKISGGLHNGGSQEHEIERSVAQGKRVYSVEFEDPKVRRIAYASGMMSGGGTARQRYLERLKWDDSAGL